MKGHLDRVLGPRALEELEDGALEKRAIHTGFDPVVRPEGRAHLGEELAEKPPRALGIVDVPWPILHPLHLPALRHVGRDRVVARHLAAVGIVAALRPRHPQSGRDDRAVDIDCQPPLPGPANAARDDERVRPLEPREMPGAERAEPTAQRAGRGQLAQATEPTHQRIAVEIAQVAEPAPAAQQERQHDEDEPDDAVIRRRQRGRQLAPQQRDPAVALAGRRAGNDSLLVE